MEPGFSFSPVRLSTASIAFCFDVNFPTVSFDPKCRTIKGAFLVFSG